MAFRRSVTSGVIRRSRIRMRCKSPMTPSRPARIRLTVAASWPEAGGTVGAGPAPVRLLEQAGTIRNRASSNALRIPLMLSHILSLRLDVDDLDLEVAPGGLVLHHVALAMTHQRKTERGGGGDHGHIGAALLDRADQEPV